MPPPSPHPTKFRLWAFWERIASYSGVHDEESLMKIARADGLVEAVDALPHGDGEADVRHVIRWGLKRQNPWSKHE
jgi:hypothetical protein